MADKPDLKKLSLDDLDSIAGGTPDEAFAYLAELKAKYGVTTGDELDALITDEESDRFAKLFWQDVDTSDMPL
jgi:hypothetical protein